MSAPVITVTGMTPPDNDDVLGGWGRNMAAARAALGLTQQDLANRIGVTVVTVARWETSARRPALTEQRSVAAALGVSVTALFPRTDDEAALAGTVAELEDILARTGGGCS